MEKSTIILEAQWMEKEIPRIEEEMAALKKLEHELLNSPLEMVQQAYNSTYQAERKKAHPFYHHRRSVRPTRYGYKERMLDVGWFTLLARLFILAALAGAVYVVYTGYLRENLTSSLLWGLVIVVVAIGLAFLPAFGDEMWERYARSKAEQAAKAVQQTDAFAQETQSRQRKLLQCRKRMAELEERLKFSVVRYEELRRQLTRADHQGARSDGGSTSDNQDAGMG